MGCVVFVVEVVVDVVVLHYYFCIHDYCNIFTCSTTCGTVFLLVPRLLTTTAATASTTPTHDTRKHETEDGGTTDSEKERERERKREREREEHHNKKARECREKQSAPRGPETRLAHNGATIWAGGMSEAIK